MRNILLLKNYSTEAKSTTIEKYDTATNPKQISKLKNDDVTIKNIAKFLGIDVNELVDYKLTTKVLSKLNFWYEKINTES